jgi:hypothetical protein
MKLKKFDEFKVNEEALPKGVFSEDNMKAIRSWSNKEPTTQFNLITETPISITTTDDVDIAKLKLLFYKYDVKFDVKELSLKLNNN